MPQIQGGKGEVVVAYREPLTTKEIRNYLARLPFKIKSEIVNKLHELTENPDNPELDIDTLKGKRGFRLRIGPFRIIYVRQDDELLIEIVKVRPRDDIYKR